MHPLEIEVGDDSGRSREVEKDVRGVYVRLRRARGARTGRFRGTSLAVYSLLLSSAAPGARGATERRRGKGPKRGPVEVRQP